MLSRDTTEREIKFGSTSMIWFPAYSREMGTIKYLKNLNCINLYLQINCNCKKITINENYSPYFKVMLLLSAHMQCACQGQYTNKNASMCKYSMRCERQMQSHPSCISSTI